MSAISWPCRGIAGWFLRERAAPDGTLVRARPRSRTRLEGQAAVQEHTGGNASAKGGEVKPCLLSPFFLMSPIKSQHSGRRIFSTSNIPTAFLCRRELQNFICLPW